MDLSDESRSHLTDDIDFVDNDKEEYYHTTRLGAYDIIEFFNPKIEEMNEITEEDVKKFGEYIKSKYLKHSGKTVFKEILYPESLAYDYIMDNLFLEHSSDEIVKDILTPFYIKKGCEYCGNGDEFDEDLFYEYMHNLEFYCVCMGLFEYYRINCDKDDTLYIYFDC